VEIGTYWRRVVSANSDRLVHAGVPDLIFPGQALVLPEP
jgi:nucleoid-associated protein YgaU